MQNEADDRLHAISRLVRSNEPGLSALDMLRRVHDMSDLNAPPVGMPDEWGPYPARGIL